MSILPNGTKSRRCQTDIFLKKWVCLQFVSETELWVHSRQERSIDCSYPRTAGFISCAPEAADTRVCTRECSGWCYIGLFSLLVFVSDQVNTPAVVIQCRFLYLLYGDFFFFFYLKAETEVDLPDMCLIFLLLLLLSFSRQL